MIRETIAPELVKEDRFGKQYRHPAFGVVVLNRSHGGDPVMFGSELRHSERMSVEIFTARHERSELSYDRFPQDTVICKLDFTLAQWSQFVASAGIGAGTPCTLDVYATSGHIQAPAIAAPENHLAKFGAEMKTAVDERTRKIREHATALQNLIDAGAGKKALREVVAEIQRHAEQLPGSVDFVNRQFAESMEDIASAAKTEIEGYVVGMALKTGIKALQQAAPQFPMLTEGRDPE